MTTTSGPMACPVDGTALTMSERAGIEIDYCPTCRGVWLDRGELDKIIERNAASAPASAAPQQPAAGQLHPAPYPPQQSPQQHAPQQQAPWGQQSYGGYGHKPHKRRKTFLEELFD